MRTPIGNTAEPEVRPCGCPAPFARPIVRIPLPLVLGPCGESPEQVIARVDRVILRDRKFADSSLEGDGFELMVRRHESRAFPSIPGIAGGSSTTALPSRRACMSLPDARTHSGLSEWSDHLIWSWTKYRSVASDVMPSAVPGNEDAVSVAPRELELEGSGPR